VDSLHHLTINDKFFDCSDDLTAAFSSTLVKHKALKSLKMRGSLYRQPQKWILWLNDTLRTAQSTCLTDIRFAIDINADEFVPIFGSQNRTSGVVNIDSHIPTIRQLRISIGVTFSSLLDEKSAEQLARVAFGKCDAKGILSLKMTS